MTLPAFPQMRRLASHSSSVGDGSPHTRSHSILGPRESRAGSIIGSVGGDGGAVGGAALLGSSGLTHGMGQGEMEATLHSLVEGQERLRGEVGAQLKAFDERFDRIEQAATTAATPATMLMMIARLRSSRRADCRTPLTAPPCAPQAMAMTLKLLLEKQPPPHEQASPQQSHPPPPEPQPKSQSAQEDK